MLTMNHHMRVVAHHRFRVRAEVAAADVVAPDHDDVGLLLLGPPFDSRPIAHSLMASHVIPLGPHAATASRLISIIILAYRPNSPFSVFKGSDSDGVSFCFGSSMAPLS